MKLTSNTTLLAVAVLIVLAGGYWYFFTGTSGNEQPLSAGPAASPAQVKFQTLVSELSPISFDTTIFSDPRFNALADLSTPVAPEAAGRLDPFAPITGVVGP